MKNLVLFIAMLCFIQVFSQRKPKIKGNKNVIEVENNLAPFDTIELNDDLKIELRKGRKEKVIINADDNLIDVLKFEVKDGVLQISSFYNITGKKKLDIVVQYTELRSIVLHDGRVETREELTADVFDAKLFGSAKLETAVKASIINLDMENNSSGDFDFQSDSLNLIIKDRVDVRLYAVSNVADIRLTSSANVKIEGTANFLNAHLFNNSDLRATKLVSEEVVVVSDGSPNVRVYAKNDFELTSRGSSKTYLTGNPKINIIEFLDTSELHKEKE